MVITTAHAKRASRAPAPTALIVGWITAVDKQGKATVDYPSNPESPLQASTLVSIASENIGATRVTLGFLDGDRCRPVITGVLQDSILPSDEASESAVAREDEPAKVHVDGRRVAIRAQEEIVLDCGKSSITLRKDGRVIIRGTKLWSRASELNRIHGANVRIN